MLANELAAPGVCVCVLMLLLLLSELNHNFISAHYSSVHSQQSSRLLYTLMVMMKAAWAEFCRSCAFCVRSFGLVCVFSACVMH